MPVAAKLDRQRGVIRSVSSQYAFRELSLPDKEGFTILVNLFAGQAPQWREIQRLKMSVVPGFNPPGQFGRRVSAELIQISGRRHGA
jgi:hypothetical protein